MNETYQDLVARQRHYFASGATLDIQARKRHLSSLYAAIRQYEHRIAEALAEDLHKSSFESYMSETGMVLEELRYLIRHLSSWARPKRVRTPIAQFPAKSFIASEPYGVTLIMAPWNYPFQLCMTPLAGALCAGNTVVLKPSAYAPRTSAIIAELVASTFDPELVTVVEGGRVENQLLLEQRFDYIFFTGSVSVGSLVMEKASRHLTPVTLELGGKSPAIVDASAQLSLAAKRIAFGKFLNAGQTCIAPDYVLVEKRVEQEFIGYLQKAIQEFFPGNDFSHLPSIVNEKHFDRLVSLLAGESCILGGETNRSLLQISPTILDSVQADSPIMQEEIFGPILPILTFETIDEAACFIKERPKPLALYVFTTNVSVERKFIREVSFGGGCINDTVVHIATSRMGFGGVGSSGMGKYHGKASFDTFSHQKGVVKKANWLDLSMRYHPYTNRKNRIIRFFLK